MHRPMTAVLRHSINERRASPRSLMKACSRIPAVKNGGICSAAMRIARNVPPHRT